LYLYVWLQNGLVGANLGRRVRFGRYQDLKILKSSRHLKLAFQVVFCLVWGLICWFAALLPKPQDIGCRNSVSIPGFAKCPVSIVKFNIAVLVFTP
jgi:hypothetical protein